MVNVLTDINHDGLQLSTYSLSYLCPQVEENNRLKSELQKKIEELENYVRALAF